MPCIDIGFCCVGMLRFLAVIAMLLVVNQALVRAEMWRLCLRLTFGAQRLQKSLADGRNSFHDC
jgi:hypothetical protein